MTQNSTPTPSLRVPVPPQGVLYSRLSTDFYPWTEVLIDLERRIAPGFSAVLDVQQETRWARFVWINGEPRGGMAAAGRDIDLETIMRGLPTATVTLSEVAPMVAELVWTCRTAQPQQLSTVWPAAYEQLSRERFDGVLVAGNRCSYWHSGEVISGDLPLANVPCVTVAPQSQVSRASFITFWRELIALTYRINPAFGEAWRQVSMQLSTEHVALDPFANEISIANGQLRVADDLSLKELRLALLAAYQASMTRMGLRLSDMPIDNLKLHEAWSFSGLETK